MTSLGGAYAKYVNGKTIAIVGRATPFKDQSAEISSHDLTAVTSYIGETAPSYWSSCDISVSARGHARSLLENPELSGSLDLDWILLRSPKYRPVGKFRKRLVGGPAFFGGLGNQVPIFLNDIVRFEPEKVTIYGTDLYLSGMGLDRPDFLHITKFVNERFDDFAAHKAAILSHDQPKVRRYYQLMFELYPFLVPDERLDRIVGMSDEKFLSELSAVWGEL